MFPDIGERAVHIILTSIQFVTFELERKLSQMTESLKSHKRKQNKFFSNLLWNNFYYRLK